MCRGLTRPQAERDLLRHDLDDVELGQPRARRTQRHVLQDRDAAGGVLDELRPAAPPLQVLNQIAPGRQTPPPPKVLKDGTKETSR